MAGANKDDGTHPEAHIWKIAPTRRDMIGFIGWGGVLTGIGLGSAAFIRMLYPRVLFERMFGASDSTVSSAIN